MQRERGGTTTLTGRVVTPLLAAFLAATVSAPLAVEPPPPPERTSGKQDRKGPVAPRVDADSPLVATLVDTHSPARLPLDDLHPTAARFEALLADPVLGGTHPMDPALLGLVRHLARSHRLARIELVSGFRSPKLNEALRKKGHHVASHSQHSLGHALDFRVVPDGETEPLDPLALAAEVRGLGWSGGVGVYVAATDRFVHADTGPLRTWYGR
jgi:uncharacterized protein YcbK (DUF882 family)